MKLKLFFLLCVLTLLYSCNKEYRYIETITNEENSLSDKEAEIIYAPSDSMAYLKAYQNFCIATKVHNDMREKNLSGSAGTPVQFSLYNEKNEDISKSISFYSKSIREQKIDSMIFSQPNVIGYDSDVYSNKSSVKIDSIKINELLPFFSQKKDEFDPKGICWFKPKSAPKYVNQNGIYLYFGKTNNHVESLRFVIQYYADDWLFIEKIQFLIDDKPYEFVPLKVKSDHSGGYIWEWIDEKISYADKSLIEALISAKSAKMKIIGNKYYKIKTISPKQLLDLNRSFELYKAMGGSL